MHCKTFRSPIEYCTFWFFLISPSISDFLNKDVVLMEFIGEHPLEKIHNVVTGLVDTCNERRKDSKAFIDYLVFNYFLIMFYSVILSVYFVLCLKLSMTFYISHAPSHTVNR